MLRESIFYTNVHFTVGFESVPSVVTVSAEICNLCWMFLFVANFDVIIETQNSV